MRRMSLSTSVIQPAFGTIVACGWTSARWRSFISAKTQTTTARWEDQYAVPRVAMPAGVGKAQRKLALDIDCGDPVTPGAVRSSRRHRVRRPAQRREDRDCQGGG